VHAVDPERRLWDLWLPNRRLGKALSDVSFRATRPDQGSEREEHGYPLHPSRVLTFPYLFLLNVVAHDPALPESVKRQFALTRTLGPRYLADPEVVLLSAFHELDRS
jgi:hypothetical protein